MRLRLCFGFALFQCLFLLVAPGMGAVEKSSKIVFTSKEKSLYTYFADMGKINEDKNAKAGGLSLEPIQGALRYYRAAQDLGAEGLGAKIAELEGKLQEIEKKDPALAGPAYYASLKEARSWESSAENEGKVSSGNKDETKGHVTIELKEALKYFRKSLALGNPDPELKAQIKKVESLIQNPSSLIKAPSEDDF